MNNNEFATYVTSLGGKVNVSNARLAMLKATIAGAVPTTIRREIDGRVVNTPSATLLLDNGEQIIAPLSTIGRTTKYNIGADELDLLDDAKVIYFVANAEEGEEFAFRPNAQPVVANTTNLLTTVHAISATRENREELRQLPKYHIDIDTTEGARDDSGEGDQSGESGNTESIADKVAKATTKAELKALLKDEAFADASIDESAKTGDLQQAMLAHLA